MESVIAGFITALCYTGFKRRVARRIHHPFLASAMALLLCIAVGFTVGVVLRAIRLFPAS